MFGLIHVAVIHWDRVGKVGLEAHAAFVRRTGCAPVSSVRCFSGLLHRTDSGTSALRLMTSGPSQDISIRAVEQGGERVGGRYG